LALNEEEYPTLLLNPTILWECALEQADVQQPTGKKFCLAVDVSGSMRQPVIGASSIEARDASAAMMLLTAKTEKEFEVVAFSEGLKELA
jgi:uncharacterized protein with von Willebrand factor type A (vWA) domain